MFKHLKDDGYYSNLYDLSTIRECLRIREYWNGKIKDLKGTEINMGNIGLDLDLYTVTGKVCR